MSSKTPGQVDDMEPFTIGQHVVSGGTGTGNQQRSERMSGEVNTKDMSNVTVPSQFSVPSNASKHKSKVSELSEIRLDDPPYPNLHPPHPPQTQRKTLSKGQGGKPPQDSTKPSDKTNRDETVKRSKESDSRGRSKKQQTPVQTKDSGNRTQGRGTTKQSQDQSKNASNRKQTEHSRITTDERVSPEEKGSSKVNVASKAHTEPQVPRSHSSRGGSRPQSAQPKKENGNLGRQVQTNSKTISQNTPKPRDNTHNESVHSKKGLSKPKIPGNPGVMSNANEMFGFNNVPHELEQTIQNLLKNPNFDSKTTEQISSELQASLSKLYGSDLVSGTNGTPGSIAEHAQHLEELTRRVEIARYEAEKAGAKLVSLQKKESTKGSKRR